MTVSPAVATTPRSAAGPGLRLHGRWLLLARAGCGAAVALTLALFGAGLPIFAAQLQTPCAGAACQRWQLSPASAQALQDAGLSLGFNAAYTIALNALAVLGFCAIAALLVWRGADEPMALFGAFTLVTMVTYLADIFAALGAASRAWRWPVTAMGFLGAVALLSFFALFPDGRFVPRWTGPAALAWLACSVVGHFSPPGWPLHQDAPLFQAVALGFFGSVVVAQLYRYRRVSTPAQRQQTKWVVCGFAAAVVVFFVNVFVILPRLATPDARGMVARLVVFASFPISQFLIPLAIGAAILRYRLWDVDPVINRALVYGVLTAGILGLYALIVGALGAVFRTGGNLAISLVATGLVAVLFQPLRQRLQRGVNRLVYGERDEPYAVLSRLGQRLEGTLAPGAVLPTIVETLAQALKVPYAAIALRDGDRFSVAAASGEPVEAPLRLPLVYQHEPVGELLLAPRAPGEPFSPADRRLLEDLARQAGIAAHAVRLTADLQRSRERLVAAREEERRRLRRDLHDGLGPALASMTLQAENARDLTDSEPARTDALLADLVEQLQAATADIRRLVYGLRPPALDELGLVAALRAHAARYDGSRLRIVIEAMEGLPPLPAAVEVAAYRIAQEALANAVRHAGARTCTIRLSLDRALCIEIADDGAGLPAARRAGVGLTSMRERAEELGGRCVVESVAGGGTRVRASLPLAARDADLSPAFSPGVE